MRAYYNEVDPFAASWLRELIKAGLIADGEVDERSIADVTADDVRGFDQCHFFAGIGGWSYALRLAGWPDDRAVWTGSCPCQPFSAAGTQTGGHDPRDLWPVWFQLVKECRPRVVFGEQVEAAIGHGWLDRVCDDLETEDYAVGACGLPGPCVGAYDIRQRLWFVADTDRTGKRADRRAIRHERDHARRCGDVGELADTDGERRSGERLLLRAKTSRRDTGEVPQTAGSRATRELGDTDDPRSQGRQVSAERPGERAAGPSSVADGFWSAVEWIPCTDGKARPVEPGLEPLAHGVPHRVGRLRGYGNAIKPHVAQVFIEAYLSLPGTDAH